MHFGRPPAIEVGAIRAECRDLELKSIFEDDDHTEMRAHRVGPGKYLLDRFRRRVGRDVEILRSLAAKKVPHASAGEVGHVTGRAQGRDAILRAVCSMGVTSFIGRVK